MVTIKQSSLVGFDTETTGLDVEECRIIEFGVAIYEAGGMVSRGHALFNPGVPIPPETTKVHTITDERVANKPGFETFIDRLRKKFDDVDVIVGYNCLNFDLPLLASELARAGVDWRPRRPVLDVKIFVDWYHRGLRKRTQQAIGEVYGINPEGGQLHSAAVDSQYTVELLYAMIEAGKIPADLDDALVAQESHRAVVEEEFRRWSYWVYRCRDTGRLRIGAGKHCGKLLTDVPKGFISFVLGLDDLHPGARDVLKSAHEGRIQDELQESMVQVAERPKDQGWGGW